MYDKNHIIFNCTTMIREILHENVGFFYTQYLLKIECQIGYPFFNYLNLTEL